LASELLQHTTLDAYEATYVVAIAEGPRAESALARTGGISLMARGLVPRPPNAQGVEQWHARFTRADGSRTKWLPLDPSISLEDEPKARACAAKLAPQVKALDPGT